MAAAGGPPLEPFLTLLAKAIQKHRNYAASNTLCARATEACHQALVGLDEDEIVLRVTPTALLLPDNTRAGESTPVQTELTRRLHRASVGTISIARSASLREIERFCRAMVAQGAGDGAESLADVLQRQGISHIQVTTLSTPAVLAVGAPDASRLACVIDQQAWHEADIAVRGAGGHLYAPNKGWIRVDPSCPLRTVSLGDLALLADDPMKLASLLVQLSDETGAATAEDALEGQLEQISHILRSLNPAFVEPMFARLAGTLLALDESRRKRLLTSVLLPGLLDGRFDGALLRQLPDSEIAAALDAFGDVQSTAPALVVFALDRLSLDANRRTRIESLLHAAEAGDGDADADGAAPGRIGGYADGRIYVEAGTGKSFDEFSTFDVSMGAEAVEAIEGMRTRAAEGRAEDEQIRCVLNLVRLESNPDAAATLLAQVDPLCKALRESAEWSAFAYWLGRLRELEESLAPDRPEVAARIRVLTASYADPALINALVDMSADDRGRQQAAAVLEALGSGAAAPAAAVLEQETSRGRRRSLLQLLSMRASAIAPGLLPLLDSPQWFTVRNVLYLLGHAGAGYEGAAAARLTHKDVRVAREAARALAQIGTSQAVMHVTSAFMAPRDTARLAIEALARFPADVARSGAKTFLAQPDLVVRSPWIASRLLDIVSASGTADLRSVLEPLCRLRLRFWSPNAMRVGFKAAALMRRA